MGSEMCIRDSVFMLISFPVQMTSWPVPKGLGTGYADAVTGATPVSYTHLTLPTIYSV